ncbi:MAG: sugar phosphate isomerase/epimerase [Bacillota bacterium]
MRIGASVLLFEQTHIVDSVRALADLGYKHIELCCESPGFDYRNVTGKTVDALISLARERGLSYTVHPHVVNTATTDPREREYVLADYIGAARLAARVGAPTIVVHSGERSAPQVSRDEAMASALEIIARVGEAAAEAGVGVLLENTGWRDVGILETPADLLTMREQCRSGTRLLLDTGHAVLQGFDPAECARLWMPHLEEIHAHDNGGIHDDHLPIGDGKIDWGQLLAELTGAGWNGLLMIEVVGHGDPMAAITRCEDVLRKCLRGFGSRDIL